MHADEQTEIQPSSPGATAQTAGQLPGENTQGMSGREVIEARRRSHALYAEGYELRHRLGVGAYGEVWLAREVATGVEVAIKFFAHGTGGQWQLLQGEVKQLAMLQADPGIVQLKDVEADATPPYYVMAYAEQGSLAERLEKQGALPIAEALGIFRQVAEALAYVHVKGIRHCDLKPGNVLLDARGRALVADFGQAHLSTDASPALGTFFYMAPEQADVANHIPDTRWDVYGLGALFFAMLTGHPPRQDPMVRDKLADTADLSHRLRHYREWCQVAPKPVEHRRVRGMDRLLADVIDRCLEIDPARRLRDAGTVLSALARRQERRRRRPLLIFGVVSTLALVLAVAVPAFRMTSGALNEAQRALTAQLLESDLTSAHLVANVVQDELTDRMKILETHAAQPQLERQLEEGDSNGLRKLLRQYDAAHRERHFLGWIVADAQGNIRASHVNHAGPHREGGNYRWRDWFHGGGDQPERKAEPFPPITKTHVSNPYWGKIVDRRVIAIATPIRAADNEQVIVGVLQTTTKLDDLHQWLTDVKIENGFAVLINERGHCVQHREQDKIKPGADTDSPTWDCPVYADLRAGVEGKTDEHVDPVDNHVYLAGYAALPKIGWGALVQHDREAAMQPIADLKSKMLAMGARTLAAIIVLTAALWGWLLWMLRPERSHG